MSIPLIRLTMVLLLLLGGTLVPLATGPVTVSGDREPQAEAAASVGEDPRTVAGHQQRDRGRAGVAVLLAAGDIASCDSRGDEATANLLDRFEGTVITLGDLAYESGSRSEFKRCYHRSWGRHKDRTRPAAGNHEYKTRRASGYFNYFGSAAGDPNTGYYSYDLGNWHIIALNSNCAEIGGCDERSRQVRWLQADLRASNADCTLAYWHYPLFTSGNKHGNMREVQPLWETLYGYGADVVLSAHEHNYERFAPQDPTGDADPSRGIRQFIVGTGGAGFSGFGSPEHNSEVRITGVAGILKLKLRAGGYKWRFVSVGSKAHRDRGVGDCHK